MPYRLTRIKILDLSPRTALVVNLLLYTAVVIVDYLTTYQLRFSPFYLLIVMLVTWCCGLKWGLFFVFASSVAQFILGSASPSFGSIYFYVDNFNRLVSYLLLMGLTAQLKKRHVREQYWARVDYLTGLLNPRGFYKALSVEIARHRRERLPMSVAYLDCDNFKEINDRLGHKEGDRLLKHVAHTISSHVRKTDVLGRLGGDEFGIVLLDTDGSRALNVVDKLRRELDAAMAKHHWPVTFSVGLGIFASAPQSEDAMISFVDTLMYRVKASGKNNILMDLYEASGPRNQKYS